MHVQVRVHNDENMKKLDSVRCKQESKTAGPSCVKTPQLNERFFICLKMLPAENTLARLQIRRMLRLDTVTW
eukprot:1161941-Pelagomonas_calceolata.AAC.4